MIPPRIEEVPQVRTPHLGDTPPADGWARADWFIRRRPNRVLAERDRGRAQIAAGVSEHDAAGIREMLEKFEQFIRQYGETFLQLLYDE